MEYANAVNLDAEYAKDIYNGILFTKNHFGRTDLSEFHGILLDLDLSILCSDEKTYLEYGKNILREYSHVKIPEIYKKRGEVLKGFLKHENFFYSKKFFGEDCEMRARQNIQKEIEILEGLFDSYA